MKIVLKVIVSALILGCGKTEAQDFRELSGSLPEFLTAATYKIAGDIFVSPGSSVTIEAGSVFLFDGFTGLHVQGTVYVKGEDGKPVVFTSTNDKQYNPESAVDPAPFDWNGLDIYETGLGTVFTNCIIRYSVYGIRSQTGHFKVVNSSFNNNGKADMTIMGERVEIPSPASFSYGLTAAAEPVKPAVEAEPDPVQPRQLPEPDQVSLDKAESREVPVQSAPGEQKRIGKQVIRYTGLAAATGAAAATAWYFKHGYKPAHEKLDELSTLDDDKRWRYSSKDWDAAKNKRNNKLGLCIAGTGGVLVGLGVFSFSFAF